MQQHVRHRQLNTYVSLKQLRMSEKRCRGRKEDVHECKGDA